MKKLILLASIVISLISCGSQSSGNQIPITVVKATVLESGTKTFIRIPNTLKDVYSVGDTVYLDLLTHRINEIDTNTARVVIIK